MGTGRPGLGNGGCDREGRMNHKKAAPFRGHPFQRGKVGRKSEATGVAPCGGRPTAMRDVENVEESDVVQSGCGLFSCIANVHLRNQNGKPVGHNTPFPEPVQNQSFRVNGLAGDGLIPDFSVAGRMHKAAHWLQEATFAPKKPKPPAKGGLGKLIAMVSCCRRRSAAFPEGNGKAARDRSRQFRSS